MKWHYLIVVLILITVLIGSCAPAPTPQATAPQVANTQPAQPTSQAEPTSSGPAASGSTIRIGILAPLTGVIAAAAKDSINGWELYWKVRGNTTVAGHPVEWYVADSANDATTAVTQAKALIDERKVNFIVGPVATAEGVAVAQETNRRGMIQFVPILSDDFVTMQDKPNLPYVVRIAGWNASQDNLPFGQWAYDQGYRKISTIGYDLQFSYDHCGAFLYTFQQAGGQVLTQVWHPITATDFSPFIAQLQQSNPDAVLACNSGIASVRLLQQWADFGLKDKIPLIATETVTDQSNLQSMDENSVLGVISSGHYAEGRDSAATQQFVDEYLKAYNGLPGYFAAANYTAADWIVKALEMVNGDVSNRDAFLAAVRNIQLTDSALGPMKLDQYDHPIQNIYIRKVEKRSDGHLWNTVTYTYPNVSQFWTFDPTEYMKKPTFSRDYQGK
jgi:branched-chain amino acid transport system substrate-binding protein